MASPANPQDSGTIWRSLSVFAAVIGVLTFCIFLYQFRLASSSISDLIEFLAAAKMAAAGHGAEIYIVPELSQVEHFLYPARGDVIFFIPPFGLPWLMPLSLLTPDMAPGVWKGFLVLCFVASLWIMRKVFDLGRTATCWLIASSCLSGCTYDALRLDQTTTFMLLGFSFAILAFKNNRPYLAGIALSVMLLKPQILLPLIFLALGAKQYRALASLLVCAIILLGVGVALVGFDGLHNYATLMQSTIESDQYLGTRFSCTLRGQLFRLLPEYRTAVHYFCTAIVCLTCTWAFKVGRGRADSKNWLNYGLFAVMPSAVVTSLYVFYYDLLLLMPTILAFTQTFRPELPSWSPWCVLFLMLIFTPPISTYFHYNWILKEQVFNPQFTVLAAFAVVSIVFYRTYLSRKKA